MGDGRVHLWRELISNQVELLMPEAWFRVLKSIVCCGLYILRDNIGAPQKLYVINLGKLY